MISSLRRLSKSTVGTAVMALILVLILVGFAMGDIQSVIRGGSFGGGSDTLVKVGSDSVSDRDMTRAMERRLSQVRQQDPEANYASIAGDFDQLLQARGPRSGGCRSAKAPRDDLRSLDLERPLPPELGFDQRRFPALHKRIIRRSGDGIKANSTRLIRHLFGSS